MDNSTVLRIDSPPQVCFFDDIWNNEAEMGLQCFFSKELHLVFPDGEQEIADKHWTLDKVTIEGPRLLLNTD